MTLALLTMFVVNGLMMASVSSDPNGMLSTATTAIREPSRSLAASDVNVSIPYVDTHYGYADGIIDPTEYAYNFTDSTTGVTVFMEHNSSVLFVGLEAQTSGWVGLAWKHPGENYTVEGITNADVVLGCAPGTPHETYPRVVNTSVIRVHYTLYARNGTQLEEGYAPDGTSDTPLYKESLLDMYKDALLGMRVGETKHFIIPAEFGYPEGSHMYGEDLEFVVTVEQIGPSSDNPADSSQIVYADAHGIKTLDHATDGNQSRIIAANASDTGTITQIEYFIRLNSTDSDDIPLLNSTTLRYPFVILVGATDDLTTLPNSHTDWAHPLLVGFTPDTAPIIDPVTPKENGTLEWLVTLQLNASDDTIVRKAGFRLDNESWTSLHYNFKTDFWEYTLDVSEYESGSQHVIWFNATDGSNSTTVVSFNITVTIPYIPIMGASVSVSRTIATLMYHTTKITDAFVIDNSNAVPISAIEFYLPCEYTSNFLSVEASDSSENPLEIVELPANNGMLHWRVILSTPVEPGDRYEFTVTMYLHSLHIITDFDNNLYKFKFLKAPVLPYIIKRLAVSMALRSGDSLHSGVNPEGVYYNIAPMTIDTFDIVLSSVTPLLVATRTTQVTVDPWGWLHYKETIHIENIGPSKELDISFKFPAYATNIKIYDDVGILAGSMPQEHDWNETLNQRINLKGDRFGDRGFWPGYKYTFSVDFNLYLPEYQTQTGDGELLTIPMATTDEILVTCHTIDVVVPIGVNPLRPSDGYRLLYGVFDATLRYTVYNTTQENTPQLTLLYQLTPAIMARPLAIALILGLVAAAYVSIRKVKMVAEGEEGISAETGSTVYQSGAPPELLSEFAKLYSKKTALNLDLDKLESSRKRGKVSKREFMKRERDIKSQLAELDTKLATLKGQLITYGSRYRDVVGQLELQEERMEGAKAGLRQLLIRKKKQKISRGAFEKTRQEYLKTVKQSVTAIDRILLSLQEEAGEI
ncbi:MAG: FKBP-type peptidyl-prolyl cis-trans isomerase [Candidatus Thorarchaeota archaeon]|nr:FKBP-type peptidyl-prolyl cis-trans isomerase [Candidatus Thorarchaeota archaeon]